MADEGSTRYRWIEAFIVSSIGDMFWEQYKAFFVSDGLQEDADFIDKTYKNVENRIQMILPDTPIDSLTRKSLNVAKHNYQGFNDKLKKLMSHFDKGWHDYVDKLCSDWHRAKMEIINHSCRYMNDIIARNIRIACFSETGDNEAMWHHYASANSGVCFEYKSRDITTWKNSSMKDRFGESIDIIHPVRYSDDAMSFFDVLDNKYASDNFGIEFDFHTLLAMRKKSEWSYEQEWRWIDNKWKICMAMGMIYSYDAQTISNWMRNPFLAPKELQKYFDINSGGYFLNFEKPTAIVLGHRITEENELRFSSIAQSINVRVYKRRLNTNKGLFEKEIVSQICD